MSQCCGDIVYEGLCVRGRPVKVMDCMVCGFKHLHPKPSEEEMSKYYAGEYFTEEKPDYVNTSGTDSEYQKLVDEEKLNACFGGCWPHGSMATPEIYEDLKKWRMLDFGCGPGAPFLKHLLELKDARDFILNGVEPSIPKDRLELLGFDGRAYGALVYPSMDNFVSNFHVVHLGFVLEHVVSPFEVLLTIKNRLREGGRIIIEVPNDFNPLQMHLWKKLGGTPWWVSSPDHLNYFSQASLFGLLEKLGFRICGIGTTYPVELFLAHGDDFRIDPEAKKKVVERRADLQRLWRDWGGLRDKIGRTVWVVGEVKT
jgi:SAM-dependent methyltransferase